MRRRRSRTCSPPESRGRCVSYCVRTGCDDGFRYHPPACRTVDRCRIGGSAGILLSFGPGPSSARATRAFESVDHSASVAGSQGRGGHSCCPCRARLRRTSGDLRGIWGNPCGGEAALGHGGGGVRRGRHRGRCVVERPRAWRADGRAIFGAARADGHTRSRPFFAWRFYWRAYLGVAPWPGAGFRCLALTLLLVSRRWVPPRSRVDASIPCILGCSAALSVWPSGCAVRCSSNSGARPESWYTSLSDMSFPSACWRS